MTLPPHWPRRLIWVARIYYFLEHFIPVPLVVSTMIFAIPAIISGLIVEYSTGFRLFTREVIMALIWLAIAPYLIVYVYRIVDDFFQKNEYLFVLDKKRAKDLLYSIFYNSGSPKYLLLSLPLSICAVLVVLFSLYATAPFAVKVWGGVTFGVLIFVAGIGFWGIFLLINLVNDICESNLKFNPYHSDRVGGLSSISQINVKIPLMFFSGTLAFPLLTVIIQNLPQNELLSLLVWILLAFYIGLGLLGFFLPQFQIHDAIVRYREESLTKAEKQLQKLLDELGKSTNKADAETLKVKIDAHYNYFNERILSTRKWPWDWTLVFQLVSSLILPLIIAFFQ